MSEFDRLKAQKDGIVNKENQMAHLAAREDLAEVMIACGLVTGHGDTIQDLLAQMGPQVAELREELADYKETCESQRNRIANLLKQYEGWPDHLAALRAFAVETLDASFDNSWVQHIAEKHGLLKGGEKTARLTG
jgi:hypothetical protein